MRTERVIWHLKDGPRRYEVAFHPGRDRADVSDNQGHQRSYPCSHVSAMEAERLAGQLRADVEGQTV